MAYFIYNKTTSFASWEIKLTKKVMWPRKSVQKSLTRHSDNNIKKYFFFFRYFFIHRYLCAWGYCMANEFKIIGLKKINDFKSFKFVWRRDSWVLGIQSKFYPKSLAEVWMNTKIKDWQDTLTNSFGGFTSAQKMS